MNEITRCSVCGEPCTGERCTRCGFEIVFHYFGMSEAVMCEEEKARIEAARTAWAAKHPPAEGWACHRHVLKYRMEVKRPFFGHDAAQLLVRITTPVVPPAYLPASVLIGNGERLPTSLQDGRELYRWPQVLLGPKGGLLAAPLNVLLGQRWCLRLFCLSERDAENIRLIHGDAKKMWVT